MSQTGSVPEQSGSFALDDIINEYKKDAAPGDYQIPPQQPAPRRSSLPTEEEVRAYLASYARGEAEPSFEPRRKAGPEPPAVDERFVTAQSRAERRRLRYGSADVDSSADESYQPPKAEGFIPTHVDAYDEEDERPDEPTPPKLFQKMRDKLSARRREQERQEAERREASRKIEVPEPQELILPGEKKPAEDVPRPAPQPETAEPLTDAPPAEPE